MNATRTHVPLILCCADDGEVALVGLLDELHRMGHSPEVLMGVESDASALTNAVDRVQGPALFVLCQSAELDRAQTRRLSGLFSARRGPGHQLLTVQVESGNGLAALPHIEAALSEVVDASPAAGADNDGYNMRDVVGPTGMTALRGDAAGAAPTKRRNKPSAAAEQAARELHEEMVAAEAVLHRRKAQREAATPSRARAPRSAHVADAGPLPGTLTDEALDASTEPLEAALAARSGELRDVGVPNLIEDDRALVGAGPAPAARAVAAERKSDRVVDSRREEDERPLPGLGSEIVASGIAELRHKAMANEVMERTHELQAQMEPGLIGHEPELESRPMGKLLLLVSGAGMAAVFALAVMSVGSDTDAPAPPPQNTTVPAKADVGGVAVGPAVGSKPLPKADGGAPPADDSGAAGDDKADGAAAADDDDDGADADADADADDDDDGADDAGEDDGGHATPPSPPTTELPPAVAQAVADGRIKRHGKILFVQGTRDTMTWDDADRNCRQRKIAGLGKWRLPNKGHLAALRRGGHVTSGSYWTRVIEGGDEAYAFDAKSANSSLWLKIEPNGRSLCVRGLP